MLFTVGLNTYDDDVHFLSHALNGLMNQTLSDYEIAITVKCADPAGLPIDVAAQCKHLLARVVHCPPNETEGNRE